MKKWITTFLFKDDIKMSWGQFLLLVVAIPLILENPLWNIPFLILTALLAYCKGKEER